jgi:hypothetical protein
LGFFENESWAVRQYSNWFTVYKIFILHYYHSHECCPIKNINNHRKILYCYSSALAAINEFVATFCSMMSHFLVFSIVATISDAYFLQHDVAFLVFSIVATISDAYFLQHDVAFF